MQEKEFIPEQRAHIAIAANRCIYQINSFNGASGMQKTASRLHMEIRKPVT